jgi:hypothetical protein
MKIRKYFENYSISQVMKFNENLLFETCCQRPGMGERVLEM